MAAVISKAALIFCSALLLSSCGEGPAPARADVARAPEVGRWSIVRATSEAVPNAGRTAYAWRIDTITGAVEMCIYDPGNAQPPPLTVSESVHCTPAQAADPQDDGR
jgi:hypothetical protein